MSIEPSVLAAENAALRAVLSRSVVHVEEMTKQMQVMGERLRLLEGHFNGQAMRHARERVDKDKALNK